MWASKTSRTTSVRQCLAWHNYPIHGGVEKGVWESPKKEKSTSNETGELHNIGANYRTKSFMQSKGNIPRKNVWNKCSTLGKTKWSVEWIMQSWKIWLQLYSKQSAVGLPRSFFKSKTYITLYDSSIKCHELSNLLYQSGSQWPHFNPNLNLKPAARMAKTQFPYGSINSLFLKNFCQPNQSYLWP